MPETSFSQIGTRTTKDKCDDRDKWLHCDLFTFYFHLGLWTVRHVFELFES